MALTYSQGYKPLPTDSGFVLPEEWVTKYLKSTENPVSPIIEYKHSTRKALAWVDMEGSIQAEIEKSPPLLLLDKGQDEDGEPISTFAGREFYWNNQIRKVAIEQGLDKHVPQVLYLVRPETAYISCLHFLARELGGIENLKQQRQFIINNSGLQTLMVGFWTRVQETHWSGGFSPSIGEQERLLLILALIECFRQTPVKRRDDAEKLDLQVPCPHLPLDLLHGAGIYLPSLEYSGWLPTNSATDQLKEMQKRSNFPGLPGPLGSYVDCYVCSTNSMNPNEMAKHQCMQNKEVGCPSCGMVLPTPYEYKIHALTFCKQGPLAQSKCACCNTPGPECLCTLHWKRTYSLVGKITQKGLVPEGTAGAATLIEARTYLGVDLVENPVAADPILPTPFQLKSSLWDIKSLRFPKWVQKNGQGCLVIPGWDNPCNLASLQEILNKRMGKPRISWPIATTLTPLKELPQGTPLRELMDKHIGPGGITVESSKAEDIEVLEDKITRTSEKLIDPQKAKILSKAMKMTIPDLWQEVKNLKDLQDDIAIHLSLQDEKPKNDRRERLTFRSPSPHGGSQISQESPQQSPDPIRRPFVFGDFNISHPSRNRSKSPGRRTSSRSPGARTGTSVRGSSKTHTIAMDLQKAASVLKSAKVDPKGTSYRRKYGDLKSAIHKADQHLRYDPENSVDPAYAEHLEDLVEAAENLLDKVDEKSDEITTNQEETRRKEEETRRKEAQIARCLPRSQPQKWDGSVNDFIRFKTSAKVLMENIPNPRLALNAIIESISDNRLRKRLSRYATPEEALTSLELEYGNPELSGPKIINDMKALAQATGVESESSLILKLKELHVALKEIKQEHLLGRNELYNLCHKLEKYEGRALLYKLKKEEPDKLREVFFHELEELYTANTIWSRTNAEKETRPRERPQERTRESLWDKPRHKTTNRRLTAFPKYCMLCQKEGHFNHMCFTLKHLTPAEVRKKDVCPLCLYRHTGICGEGTERFLCPVCKLGHRGLTKMHSRCMSKSSSTRQRGPTKPTFPMPHNQGTTVTPPAPPLQLENSSTNRHLNTDCVKRDYAWRSQGGPLANPNPLNSAFEVVDHAVIEAPDGRLRKIRVLHDEYAADSTLADISLESFSHRTGAVDLDLHTANGTSRIQTDEMVLKLILPNGKPRFLKTISTEMRAQKAFKLTQKTIDVPMTWNSRHFKNQSHVGPHHNIRCLNFTEGPEIELLIGGDNAFLAPVELDRYEDHQGCVTLFQSPLQSDLLLLGGSRIVGHALVPTVGTSSRGFRLTTENQEASVRRTAIDEPEPVLFPENPLSKMSKLDQQFFREFEDSNLLPPHPRVCKGCAECPTCSDSCAAEKKKAIKEKLDQLCQLDTEKPWPDGGWHIKLMWNGLKEKVPTNEQDAIRRFLSTERQISKSPSALRSFNEQVAKCLALGYFVLAKDFPHKEAVEGKQASFLPLSYALKDTVETADTEEQPNLEPPQPKLAQGKTKARPVSDGSHKANAETPSVNDALIPIPDLWTGKIQNLMIKFRTARRLAMADISQYFHRLRLDLDSVSMTRAIWREGGIGGTGELTTMFVPSASMGLTPVPALASHCRARTADLMTDPVARESITHSYCDDVYLPTLWGQATKPSSNHTPHEQDEKLLQRIQETEEALNKAKLQLGEAGWVTDLDQCLIPISTENVKGVTENVSSRVIGLSTTGALGLRWNLGSHLPNGGTFSYRVHRPGSLNLLPKKRGKRPPEGELHNREDIRNFLATKGMTKAGLLRLVMNLFDVLQLALPWTATAKLLYREVLTENPGLGWKEQIPQKYHQRVENLATDLLTLSKDQSFPRRALQEGPDGTIGHITLIICHDGSADSAAALAYVHQQWPRESARLPSSDPDDCSSENITTKVTLLCGGHKLTEHGHEEQVASELLSAVIAVKLKKIVIDNSLVKFDKVMYLGDSMTVARVLRKSNRAYSVWAGTRVSFIQRNENIENMFHVPGSFLVPTADKATRSHPQPSLLMDDAYWKGTDTLDTPLHLLPITPPSTYSSSGLNELPQEWLHKATVRLNPVGLSATVTCHRIEVEADDDETMLQQSLHRLKVKYRSFNKIKRIMKFILNFSPAHKDLSHDKLWDVCEIKWLSLDHDILKASLKVTPIPQTFLVQEDQEQGVYYAHGRNGYRVPLLANPKKSRLTRVILKQYHDENHLSSPATVQALVFKRFYVMGGAAAYIKRLQKGCFRCHILKPKPSMGLAGPPPEGTQGPLSTDKSIWRRWMLDICGPIILSPWAGRRATRSSQKNLKHWILVAVDLCSRQVDAVLLEGYSTSAVLTGLREFTARHGIPSDIYWDRASNLHAAAALLSGEDEKDGEMDASKLIKVQEQLRRSFETNGITVHLSIPYSSHRQGRVEAAVKRIKNQLVELAYDESQTKLTPMEATSLLASACDVINNRPLLLTAEASLEEKHVLTPSYLTCSDLNLEKGGSGMSKCHQDPGAQKWFSMRESPLNRRAIMVQERLKTFKEKFETFMTKSLASLGKFNRTINPIKENDVVLIMDKIKETLPVQCKKRYTLGVVEKMLSERSCVIRYICKATSGALRTDRCERSIQGLSLLVEADEAKEVKNKDLVIDPVFPAGSLM